MADGTIDYTIADSTEFALAHDVHPDLRIAFDFPGDRPLAWAASNLDPSFARDMTEYFARLKLDGELATIVNRYYGRSEDADFVRGPGFMQHLQSRLPLYKQWFVEAAEQSSEDWRLLAAIGYQESKWNPSASSSADQGYGPIGCAAKHFWRRPLFSAGIRKDSFPRFRAGPDLVCARRI